MLALLKKYWYVAAIAVAAIWYFMGNSKKLKI